MKIVLLHPDLGIGGAERLMIDIALSLKTQEHDVKIVTSHHDPAHCFEETKDGTLDVTVVGKFLPRNVFGRFHAACAYLKMLYSSIFLFFMASEFKPAVIICDQVSVCIPILKLLGARVVFYGHYPDKLLTSRTNRLKWFYRLPLDWLEEKTTSMADVILVNSRYTRSVFYDAFKSLKNTEMKILYPTISKSHLEYSPCGDIIGRPRCKTVFLSVNRFERKKHIELAIQAMSELKKIIDYSQFSNVQLLIIGGYDERLAENTEYFSELMQEAENYGILDQITFMKSPSDKEKCALYYECLAVLYTPCYEHFGIVPIEAMFSHKPVIACNSGGPLETIINGKTGFLCESTPYAFALKMKYFVLDNNLAVKMGETAFQHVQKNFSFSAFTENLKNVVNSIC